MEKFIVTPKEDKTVTMTIRIDRALQEEYNRLAAKTNRSRNELIGMALQYALDHMELKNCGDRKSATPVSRPKLRAKKLGE